MSALRHLRETGQLDHEGATLLYSTVERVVRSRNFPPPEHYASWTDDAVKETAHDFLSGTNALARLLKIALLSASDDHFAGQLHTAVLNHLRSSARQSTVGKIMRKLRDIAHEEDGLERIEGPPEAIRIAGSAGEQYSGADDPLLKAAAAVQTDTIRWRPDAERGVPIANRRDLFEVLLRVLETAESAVSLVQISRIVARRFNLSEVPTLAQTDTLDPRASGGFDEVEVADQAELILEQLTERERLVLPLMDLSVRDAGTALGLSRSTVAREQVRIRSILDSALPGAADGETILRLLQERVSTASNDFEEGR